MYLTELYTTTKCTAILNLVLVFGKNASFTFCLNMETRLSRIINKIKELNLVVMFYIWKLKYFITICDDFHIFEIENVNNENCFVYEKSNYVWLWGLYLVLCILKKSNILVYKWFNLGCKSLFYWPKISVYCIMNVSNVTIRLTSKIWIRLTWILFNLMSF